MTIRVRATLIWLVTTLIILSANFASVSAAGEKKLKAIDFEDELVEGMHRRNLDSLSYLGEKEQDRKRKHLYRKRVSFKGETSEMMREVRYR